MTEDDVFIAINDDDILKLSLASKIHDLSTITFYGGYTPLLYALYSEQINTAKFLLDLDVDIHVTDNDSHSALYHAIYAQNYEMVSLLLERSLDPNGVNHKSEPLLTSSFHVCRHTFNTNEDIIKELVKYGADINALDSTGRTLLALVCTSGDLEIAQYLIEQGAKLDTFDNRGDTPLCRSLNAKHYDIASLLIQHGVSVNQTGRRSFTPLMLVVQNKETRAYDILTELINAGADINARDQKGSTALIIAAKHKNELAMQLLLQYGASTHFTNTSGETYESILCNRVHMHQLNEVKPS